MDGCDTTARPEKRPIVVAGSVRCTGSYVPPPPLPSHALLFYFEPDLGPTLYRAPCALLDAYAAGYGLGSAFSMVRTWGCPGGVRVLRPWGSARFLIGLTRNLREPLEYIGSVLPIRSDESCIRSSCYVCG